MAISSPIEIDRRQVLSRIGYANNYHPPSRMASLVDDCIKNYHDLVAPLYSYVIKEVISVEGSNVALKDAITFKSKVIARLLARCRKVAIFAATIGSQLEEMASHLAEKGLVLQAMVLDAMGSDAIENLADHIENEIRRSANLGGLAASLRFSPGYCDWAVSQQQKIFQALNGDTAGIRLTGKVLMIPQKSVSGIIGIGLAENGIEDYNPCHTCQKRDCPGRR